MKKRIINLNQNEGIGGGLSQNADISSPEQFVEGPQKNLAEKKMPESEFSTQQENDLNKPLGDEQSDEQSDKPEESEAGIKEGDKVDYFPAGQDEHPGNEGTVMTVHSKHSLGLKVNGTIQQSVLHKSVHLKGEAYWDYQSSK